ncbi:MAG: tetratricopeptide repeat protein [Pyrinomonadaceae bacterium]|nr:tetratricopeptide repeat protein [Pyrinomonadaceae bacterium]
MLEQGKIISDYVLIEKIGHGGFGDVWLAEKRTPLSVSQFALKFFRPQTADEIEIQTVQREIEVWQKISGLPNVISVIEADFAENYIYIVSEYADGGSLQHWLAANGGKANSIEQAVGITLEILNGLEHLHRAGFIHRDIKPANILIRKGTFCLADFGVTREIKTHSITLHTAGTYNYMPPEAFGKKPAVSPATDVWAVAVIFQELLTGELPFSSDEVAPLMYSILHDEPDEMPDYVPSELKIIVRRALYKERADRYATAQEMIDALKHYQGASVERIALPLPEEIRQEPKKAVIADTIFDESFVQTNYVTKIEQPPATTADAPPKPVAPAAAPINQTLVSSTKKLKRNKLLVAGIAAALLFGLGAFFIAANLFSTTAAEYYERGLACTTAQDYDCAINNFGKAIESNPDYGEAYKHRAATFYTNGDFQKAIEDYNRAVELNPQDASALYGRGAAFSNSGNFDRAIEDYTQAVSINPQDASFVYSRGLAFYSKGEYEKAIKDYDRAIELNPQYAEAFNNRGNALDEQGKNKQAIENYTKAIETDGNFALAYSNRGASYARQGSYARAVEDLNKALEIDPDLSIVYLNRANIYYLKNDSEKALADYNRFIELNPNNFLAFSNRGGILGNQGNYAQAIEDYNRAVELNPQDAQSYYNRALIYEKIGNKDKARSDRQRFNDLSLKR